MHSRNSVNTAAFVIGLTMIAFALLLSGCAGTTVYEVAGGVNVTRYTPWSEGLSGGFAGPPDTLRLTVRREDNRGRTFCGFSHVSHLSAGWPVNDHFEDWLDIIECGVRFTPNR